MSHCVVVREYAHKIGSGHLYWENWGLIINHIGSQCYKLSETDNVISFQLTLPIYTYNMFR